MYSTYVPRSTLALQMAMEACLLKRINQGTRCVWPVPAEFDSRVTDLIAIARAQLPCMFLFHAESEHVVEAPCPTHSSWGLTANTLYQTHVFMLPGICILYCVFGWGVARHNYNWGVDRRRNK